MAITATFNPSTGVLSLLGDASDETILVSLDTSGNILVNLGAVAISGGTPTAANTVLIAAGTAGGNDTIDFDEFSGALPPAILLGGDNNDVLIAGGANDFIAGNQGNDIAVMGGGDDVFQWDPGDGNDSVVGGANTDTLLFNGSKAGETIDISANASHVRFSRDIANVTMDLNEVEHIRFNALGGADIVTVNDLSGTDATGVTVDLAGTRGGSSGDGQIDQVVVNATTGLDPIAVAGTSGSVTITGLAAQVSVLHAEATDRLIINGLGDVDLIDASGLSAGAVALTVDSGAGNDAVLGSKGDDTIIGGPGFDQALMDAGDDTFIWNPGDGSDKVFGDSGIDTLLFNGSDAAEKVEISPNGGGDRFLRDVANVTMDLSEVETVQFNAFGGADTVTVDDLRGTSVNKVAIDLAAAGGGGDAQRDTVILNGVTSFEQIAVTGSGTSVAVDGLPGAVTIAGAEGANDVLVINVGGASDVIDASGLAAGVINLKIDAGAGDDLIIGSQGGDLLLGGDNNDFIIGAQGNDLALLGPGDDTFRWNPGDGSDVVAGQAGFDKLVFVGAAADEQFEISASGARALVHRDVGNVTIHNDGVERIELSALGGADTITVGDLSGTDVTEVAVDLAGAPGGSTGDGLADQVSAEGTDDVDTISVKLVAGAIVVEGLAAALTITHADGIDELLIQGLGGNDTIDVSALAAGSMSLTLEGGAGDDTLIGGAGEDTAVFNVDFDTVDVVFEGGKVFIVSAEGHDEVKGIENFQFTDGTIHLNDGSPLVNDLFYYANNKDVWDAGTDADAHYNSVGFQEGRDPNPEFSTNGYLSANPDVRAAGLNPLQDFDQFGWKEGRDPSTKFDVEQYLQHNPDVAASGVNPLAQFEEFGRDEGRQTFAAIGGTIDNGFDAEFYLLGNPDVGFAGLDPGQHYHTVGFTEGRDPNAFFDTKGYLAAYADVAAAGTDPLEHYFNFGAQEGRDPSGAFDTLAYLAANPDVAASGINPLQHFLQIGAAEGRLPLGDGVFA
jgi:Ca2+-binding RTX toxin-like protein